MYISNYINGQNVQDTEMNNEYASLEHTTNFFNNIVPCVYYGNTAVISGLNVTVLAGEGRAKDVVMSWLNYTNPLMIEYNVIETVLSIPENVTDGNGFIVVNSNINSISVGGRSYTTTDTIQFVTSLTSSFPSGTLIGQVPLYSVTSNATSVVLTNIAIRLSLYNPDMLDDISNGNVTIGGRLNNSTNIMQTISDTGRKTFINTHYSGGSISDLAIGLTLTNGVSIESSIIFQSGRSPAIISQPNLIKDTSTLLTIGDNGGAYISGSSGIGNYSYNILKIFQSTGNSMFFIYGTFITAITATTFSFDVASIAQNPLLSSGHATVFATNAMGSSAINPGSNTIFLIFPTAVAAGYAISFSIFYVGT